MYEEFYNELLKFFRELPLIVTENSDQILKNMLFATWVFVGFLWVYCGIIVYRDARRRFSFRTPWFYLFLFVTGFILGPFGLIVYILTRPKNTRDEVEFIKIEHKFYHHQASKIIDCINCGAYVLENQLYCTNCGTQNRFKCASCGALYDNDDLFCPGCGKELQPEHLIMDTEDNKVAETTQKSVKIDYIGLIKSRTQKYKESLIATSNSLLEKFKSISSNSKNIPVLSSNHETKGEFIPENSSDNKNINKSKTKSRSKNKRNNKKRK